MSYSFDSLNASTDGKYSYSNLYRSKSVLSLSNFSLLISSWIHHSSTHPDGYKGWLFLKNSPNATSMSPKNSISVTSFLTSRAFLTLSSINTSPFLSLTVGPSMESTGTTQLPFPGYSILSCVPTARNSSNAIVAG